MSKIEWSKDQEKVITRKNKDILVSAAAGSGKTTVLVERIIRKIKDTENPVDIDELLVVTFTKAAAGEMKARIAKALDEEIKALEEQGDKADEQLKKRLLRQSTLVQHAMITTIDSFCLFVVRNYFEEIGIDPNLRPANDTEVELIVQDVLDRVFEENYNSENNEKFLNLIDTYSDSKGDKKVRGLIERIYYKSKSAPWPKRWIQSLSNIYQSASEQGEDGFAAINKLMDMVKAYLSNYLTIAEKTLSLALEENGPDGYVPAIQSDIKNLNEGIACENYTQLYDWVNQEGKIFIDLGKKHNNTVDPVKADKVKKQREIYKGEFNKKVRPFFVLSWQEFCEQQQRLFPYVEEIVRLSLDLYDAVLKEKQKRKMLDFSDMEHYALQILVDEETGEPRPVAKVFRNHFKEIMIDEYQDSNDVQETILKAVSYDSEGKHNMFMVGDVKQSIYSFRMAKPALFVGKYDEFSDLEDSEQERIDLSSNYRSREGVLDFCNVIFEMIMERELGGVVYNDKAKLNYGSKYTENNEPCAEVLLFNTSEEIIDADLEIEKNTEIEARIIAHRIKDLVGTMDVQDGKDSLRKATLSDIVILVRSTKTVGPVYQEVLQKYGIPAHVDSYSGYFDATEVNLILNILKLIDNPLQDVPMAAVLKSPIVGLTDEDLAEIKVTYQNENNTTFAQASLNYLQEQENDFYSLLMELRERKDLSVHEMIQFIFKKTGYDSYVAALPAGNTRYANLMMLVQKAIEFEGTSYKGVFHFLRFIEKMRKYEKDFGEADTEGESGNIVHIMTIHKSKGLEFPIVFLSSAQTKFNSKDESGDMVLHESMGIGLKEYYGNPCAVRNTMLQDAIKNYIHIESLSEELRVLYVGMTRAKEKLIITGFGKTDNISFDPYVSFGKKITAKNYLDWILPALYATGNHNLVEEVNADYLKLDDAVNEMASKYSLDSVKAQIKAADSKLVNSIRETFDYVYPFLEDVNQKSKLSVSELKIGAMAQAYDEKEGEVERPGFAKHETEAYIPRFARKYEDYEKKAEGDGLVSGGALYGTAVHRMMEVLDFTSLAAINMSDDAALQSFASSEMGRMKASGELEADLAKRIHGDELVAFLKSPIAGLMADAAARGELYREKPFVMSMDKGVLVQGIIDVFWRDEDGAITVLDYKTDSVKTAEELVLRYKEQLILYADALERIYGNVKESLIYSYRLKEVISL